MKLTIHPDDIKTSQNLPIELKKKLRDSIKFNTITMKELELLFEAMDKFKTDFSAF